MRCRCSAPCCRAAAARASTRTSFARSSWRPTSRRLPARAAGPSLFTIVGTVNPGKTVAELEAAVDAEIERVKAGPIDEWEIEKARNNARTQLVNSLGSVLDRAVTLGEDALFYNDPGPHQHARGSDRQGDRGGRAARGQAVSGQDRTHRRDHGAQGCAGQRRHCDETASHASASRLSPSCVRRDGQSRRSRHPAARRSRPRATGVVVKGKAPVSNDILKVTLPKPQEADLPNGLHLMVLEDHRLPRVAFQIIIPGAGGYFDPPAMIGLSTYTAQMMREGTTQANVAADLAGARDDVGVGDRRQQPVRAVCDRVWQRAHREPAAAVRLSRPTSCSIRRSRLTSGSG